MPCVEQAKPGRLPVHGTRVLEQQPKCAPYRVPPSHFQTPRNERSGQRPNLQYVPLPPFLPRRLSLSFRAFPHRMRPRLQRERLHAPLRRAPVPPEPRGRGAHEELVPPLGGREDPPRAPARARDRAVRERLEAACVRVGVLEPGRAVRRAEGEDDEDSEGVERLCVCGTSSFVSLSSGGRRKMASRATYRDGCHGS